MSIHMFVLIIRIDRIPVNFVLPLPAGVRIRIQPNKLKRQAFQQKDRRQNKKPNNTQQGSQEKGPIVVQRISAVPISGNRPPCPTCKKNHAGQCFFGQKALSVIPRGSWGDVARRFTMIRWISSKICFWSHKCCEPMASCIPEPMRVTQVLVSQFPYGYGTQSVEYSRRKVRTNSSPLPSSLVVAVARRRRNLFRPSRRGDSVREIFVDFLVQIGEGVEILVVDRIRRRSSSSTVEVPITSWNWCIDRYRAPIFKFFRYVPGGIRIRRYANSGIRALAWICHYTILPELHQKSHFSKKKNFLVGCCRRPPACNHRQPCTTAAPFMHPVRATAACESRRVSCRWARSVHASPGVARAGRYPCEHVVHGGACTLRMLVRALAAPLAQDGRVGGRPPVRGVKHGCCTRVGDVASTGAEMRCCTRVGDVASTGAEMRRRILNSMVFEPVSGRPRGFWTDTCYWAFWEPAGTSKWTIDDDVIGEDIMTSSAVMSSQSAVSYSRTSRWYLKLAIAKRCRLDKWIRQRFAFALRFSRWFRAKNQQNTFEREEFVSIDSNLNRGFIYEGNAIEEDDDCSAVAVDVGCTVHQQRENESEAKLSTIILEKA
ncbi:polyol transporter 5-like [Dorcoceras hygrometricum]|uniref:Polyol transporter 5-like n=1 Tax=Dorcoceras hygrometricum TaxID=472368 RepID=A0A2Z7CP57_9LAMI|nr:polyol transporter 5-like [Dorcoceras hygrometricum]